MGELYFQHYGTKRHSGRYPWGSGENPYQRDKIGFYKDYTKFREDGLSEAQIAEKIDKEYFGGEGKFKTSQLRAWVTIGKEQTTAANISRTMELKRKGMSNVAIGKELGVNESVVRSWLDPARKEKLNSTRNIAECLKKEIETSKYLELGKGDEIALSCSPEKLKAAVAILEEEGYKKHFLKVEQQGNLGNFTWVQVLAKDDVPWTEIRDNMDQVKLLSHFQSMDGGKTIKEKLPPRSISSDRIKINYGGPDGTGGEKKDGVIEIRPGVPELSLGNDAYAQVRIAVDGTHYLKGMAIYNPNLPKGVDIVFNTHKSPDTPMMNKDDPDFQVLKTLKKDKDLPFGANTKENESYIGKDGKEYQSCVNKVNSDEDWDKWSKNLASQFLSKQPNQLAKQQLGIAYDVKENEFETLKANTNPTIKKKLLEEFADECDSAAVKLKAAPLSGQATHVILPLNNIKDNEIYAPNYKQGEEVVLIRYPHTGPFESPRLKVNNRNVEGKEVLGNAKHAVGINSNVAKTLSGADFDGDTVVVLPVRGQNIKTIDQNTDPYYKELKDFDHMEQYKAYKGMPRVGKEDSFRTNMEMGKISNLITDMTVAGAPSADMVKAVKHSMVVIDAEKHNLNYKQSYEDNNIAYLKKKYQSGGASTIISMAKSPVSVGKRKEIISPSMMTPEEKKRWDAGEKVYRDLNEKYIVTNKKKEKMTEQQIEDFYAAKREYQKTGIVPPPKDGVKYIEKTRQTSSNKMAEAKDARDLISKHNTVMENIYANYANNMKRLALEARKEARATGNMTRDPVAAKTYATEVESINNKIKIAKLNKPRERQAQMIANKKMKVYEEANPDATKEELKKKRNKILAEARVQAGCHKSRVTLDNKEVEAVLNGAISNATMLEIFNNGDQDQLKKAFTPKTKRGMTNSQISRAKRLLKAGYTQADVAETLGVSVSTILKNVDF